MSWGVRAKLASGGGGGGLELRGKEEALTVAFSACSFCDERSDEQSEERSDEQGGCERSEKRVR